MATAGLIILLLLAGLSLMVIGGAFTLASVRKGNYIHAGRIGVGPIPNDATGVCEIIDTLPREEQLRVTLAGLITMNDAEEDNMARAIEERFAAQVERRRTFAGERPQANMVRRVLFGRRTRNLDLGA